MQEYEYAYLEPLINPFSGETIDKDCCALCGATLPLPGEYPMLVIREEPDARFFDCTGDPDSTDEHGHPRVLQTGLKVLRPICLQHVQQSPHQEVTQP